MREWLIELRKNKKMSQQKLADEAKITRQMISAIENEKALPSVEKAIVIAKILDFNWTNFFESG